MPERNERMVRLEEGDDNLKPIAGSRYETLNNVLANQALSVLWTQPGATPEARSKQQNAALAAMLEFKPTDSIEGMMAAQAIGLHSAAIECLRRAMIAEQGGEASNMLRRQGANLSRAFLDVVSALDKKRGKGGHQVVRVERVMVAPGGQAIVGNVQAGAALGTGQHREGVGHEGQTRREPHASPTELAHDAPAGAVLPPLRVADPDGQRVPVASDEQWPMPDARRKQYGT